MHHEREVERAFDPLLEGRVDRKVRLAIDVQGVMNHRDHGHTHRLDAEQAPGQGLIVEDHVEAIPRLDFPPASHEAITESLHFREDTETRNAELPERQRLEHRKGGAWIDGGTRRLTEDVAIRDLVKRNAFVELRKGRTGKHVNIVPGALPLACEIRGVDPLAAAKHVAAVGEECDAHERVLLAESEGEGNATARWNPTPIQAGRTPSGAIKPRLLR